MSLICEVSLTPDEVASLAARGCITFPDPVKAKKENTFDKRKYQKQWRLDNREKVAASQKLYRQNNRGRRNKNRRDWWQRNLEKNRKWHREYMRRWREKGNPCPA